MNAQGCCDGEPTETYEDCCDDEIYNNVEEVCCGNTIYRQADCYHCCGNSYTAEDCDCVTTNYDLVTFEFFCAQTQCTNLRNVEV